VCVFFCFLCFWFVYFRFLNSFVLSISVMYWKPASISCVASCIVVAVLHVHSSVSLRNVACSMLMYIIVLVMSLCPNICFTWIMSLVLWYSIVAFQCLNVWKDICLILGLFSLFAVRIFSLSILVLTLLVLHGNTKSVVFVNWFSIPISFVLIGSILGLLPFSGLLMCTVFLSVSMSIHCVFNASPILAPVSLRNCSKVAVLSFGADAINWSISCSVGMNGRRSSALYFGGFHFLFMYSTYPL